MSIVITGANGFVGKRLVTYLQSQDIPVLKLERGGNPRMVMDGADCVVHLAARVHVMKEVSTNPLAEFRRSNVENTIALARQAAASRVTRFVFISSVKVNGEQTLPNQPFQEIDHPNPQDDYALSKYEAELALRRIAVETGLEVVIIRPPLVYGPGVKANFAALMRGVKRGWPMPFGEIHNSRSLVSLDNLVDFIYCCVRQPAAANQTFLVSDGQDVSSPQLVREIATAAGVKSNVWNIPLALLRLGGVLAGKHQAVLRLCGNLQVDITKAKMLLGWNPPFSMQEGLKRALSEA